MSVKETFEADFTPFKAAVQGASVSIKSFTTDTEKVTNALGKMADQFSGQKVIQQATLMAEAVERVGGAGQLTEKELQRIAPTINEAIAKMQLLGLEVPAGMQKIAAETKTANKELGALHGVMGQIGGMIAGAFTVQAVINFGRSILDTSDAIVKMSDQTGMTIEEVQRLQYVAGQTSVSMDTMVSAAQNVTVKLGEGDAGLTGALKTLHINMDAFQKLDSYNQFLTLAGAIGDVKDPTEKAAVAAATFGKNWKEIFPLLNQQMRQLADDATVASDKTIKTVDNLGDRLAAAGGRLTAWGSTALAGVMTGIESAAAGFGELGGAMLNWRNGFETYTQQMARLSAGQDPFLAAARNAEILQAKLPPVISGFKMITLSAEQLKDAETAHVTDTAAAWAKHQASVEAEKDAYAALEGEFRKYQAEVDALVDKFKGNDVQDAAGKWSKALAAVGDDVGRLSSKMRDELGDAMRQALEAMARNGTLTEAASSRYTELMIKVDAYNASLKASATQTLPAASGATTDYTQKLYDEARAQDAVAQAAARANAERARALNQEMAAATGGEGGAGKIGYLAPRGSADYNAATGAITSGSGAGSSYYTPPRAAGGPVAAGTSYLVGERGPELFTPGASGAISAGGAVVNNVFHLVDTESNLARRVSDLILRSVTQARRV